MSIFSAKVRATSGIIGGLLLISIAIGGYAYMHFRFFGAPHFATSTPMGRSEILYAVSTLMVAGFGVHSICAALRARRELR